MVTRQHVDAERCSPAYAVRHALIRVTIIHAVPPFMTSCAPRTHEASSVVTYALPPVSVVYDAHSLLFKFKIFLRANTMPITSRSSTWSRL